ncbi:hypothetical protein ACHAWO_007071 [Cyclotella atomus]|uniref:Uncharacterized protein n=1 Tax=Cyclotella atomus TaxID=382360 RepID=A0ABD3MP50_9STRA
MATNAVGSYKIGRTLNGSVHHQFWFSKDGNNWMQLVELPEALSMETRRILMALLQKIRSHHPGTRIHFYDSRLCDPYVLINGRDRHAVESVAEDVWWCSIATAEHESHVIARHRFMKRSHSFSPALAVVEDSVPSTVLGSSLDVSSYVAFASYVNQPFFFDAEPSLCSPKENATAPTLNIQTYQLLTRNITMMPRTGGMATKTAAQSGIGMRLSFTNAAYSNRSAIA